MLLLDISTFLGRLHPLTVHLPIGFLLLAALFDLLSYFTKLSYLKPAVVIILLLGFVSAAAACVFGYLLSISGDYDVTILNYHMISGIILAVFSCFLYVMSTKLIRDRVSAAPRIVSFSFPLLVIIMVFSGHQGSTLTHGADYLAFETIKQRRQKPVTAGEALIFEDVIHPLLDKKCAQCHNAGKLKGKLSVETLAAMIKGGKSGPAIVPGNLDQSELYRRISLDPADEDYMPKEGKTPLTKTETEIIRWWIEAASATGEKKLDEIPGSEQIKPKVASVLGLLGGEANVESMTAETSANVNPEIPPTLDQKLIEDLRMKGFMVRIMLHKPVMLDVTLPAESNLEFSGASESLKAVAAHIVWLNLSGNGLTESDLDFLPLAINIEKLRLDKNPVGDGICGLITDLKHLESLNLNETHVSAECVEKIRNIPTLKRVYTWKTTP